MQLFFFFLPAQRHGFLPGLGDYGVRRRLSNSPPTARVLGPVGLEAKTEGGRAASCSPFFFLRLFLDPILPGDARARSKLKMVLPKRCAAWCQKWRKGERRREKRKERPGASLTGVDENVVMSILSPPVFLPRRHLHGGVVHVKCARASRWDRRYPSILEFPPFPICALERVPFALYTEQRRRERGLGERDPLLPFSFFSFSWWY